MNAPAVAREQLIADERAAEQAVLQAESDLAFIEIDGTPEEIAAARQAVADARTASLATRQVMQDGLDAWTRYAAYQEAVARAEANGVPIPARRA